MSYPDYRIVSIRHWPEDVPLGGRFSPFSASWSDTMDLLGRELAKLDGGNVVLQMAVRDRDIRIDGRIRANARSAEHPGVILTFDSKHGPLSYPCGAFSDWRANVRAIALALEALRKVDRYGISGRGEQYTGWKQIPGAGKTGVTMTTARAAEVMCRLEGRGEVDYDSIIENPDAVRATYLNAAKRVHPDGGGSIDDFQLLQTARAVLEAHQGTS